MPLDLDDLDDAEKFQKHFVTPLVEAVRAEMKPLTTTVYATRERVKKLEGNQMKAMLGFAGMATALSVALGLGVDWLRKKVGL